MTSFRRGMATIGMLALFSPSLGYAEGTTAKAAKVVDIACVQTAVATRESALITGWTTSSAAVLSAFQARKTALNTAWGTQDATQRKTAVKAAWNTFKQAKKTAAQGWKTAHKNAWTTFRTAAKACKGAAAETAVEQAGEGIDQ